MKSGLIAKLRRSARAEVPAPILAAVAARAPRLAMIATHIESPPKTLANQIEANHKLMKAAKVGKVRRINHQIAKGASVHFRDALGFTPLLVAAMHDTSSYAPRMQPIATLRAKILFRAPPVYPSRSRFICFCI